MIIYFILFLITVFGRIINCGTFLENNDLGETSVNDRYYPRYHLAPLYGWLNDPCGCVFFQNEYHLFYQWNPKTSLEPGIAHWGHAKSKDFLHWEHLPLALAPDQPYDKTGVFSGSALVEGDTMYLFYTANVNRTDFTWFREETQAMAVSTDGINFKKHERNPILYANKYQPDIRDPKVWIYNNTYYMIIGASYNNSRLGIVTLFSSPDKFQWEEACVIGQSYGSMGYMWECPDLFTLNGTYIFLFSPQGMKPEGDKFRNLFQVGYMTGYFDYQSCNFTPSSEFRELDHGHDFYATSTFVDEKGRRLLIAWSDTWYIHNYPEEYDGWTGQMTLPRELVISESGYIIQKPLVEMEQARSDLLFFGNANESTNIMLKDKAGEIIIETSGTKDVRLFIEASNDPLNESKFGSAEIFYDSINGKMIVERRGPDSLRRTDWRPHGRLYWRIFVDASSIELFCGEGEVTFTSRYFPQGDIKIRLGSSVDLLTVYTLKRTVPKP